MKSISSTFAIAFLALFMSAQANAGHHTAEALEHAGMAQAHGEDGHAKVLVKHATVALKHAKEAEKVHADFYEKAIESLKQGQDAKIGDLHICSVCGYTSEGDAPEKCPVCGESRDKFVKAE